MPSVAEARLPLPDATPRVLTLVLAVLAGTTCMDVTGPTPPPRYHARAEWVSGDAATALDTATGIFRLVYPPARVVSLGRADSVALAEARILMGPDPFGVGITVLERDRGAPIDLDGLRPCDRRLYVRSALGEFPPPVPAWIRRGWGPTWAIGLCSPSGTAQLAFSIPDYQLDLAIVDGKLVSTRTEGGGANLNGAGVPERYPSGLPLPPEEAVGDLFTATALRITNVPLPFDQLDDRGVGQLAHCASWRLILEAPAHVRSMKTGSLQSASEFFVRRGPACYSDSVYFYIASTPQPPTMPMVFPADTVGNTYTMGLDTVAVPLVGPVKFERVEFVR